MNCYATRTRALATLLGLLVVVGVGILYPAVPPRVRLAPSRDTSSTTDAQTFAAVVDRLSAGETYYDAMGVELRNHDYPTLDPFNWRTPLHLSVLALAPWDVWRGVLTALLVALYVLVMAIVQTRPAAWIANV